MSKSAHGRRPRGRPVSACAAFRLAADLLRARIEAGEWTAEGVLPSRRALARQYGLGEQTLRLALAKLQAEGCLGSSANRRCVVRSEGHGPQLTEGLILEVVGERLHLFTQHPDHAALRRGIEREAGEQAAPILIAHHEHFRGALPPNLDRLALRGILLLGTFHERALRAYQRLRVPVVLVNRPGLAWKLHAIRGDNIHGCAQATQRLVELGHRRIAFVRLLQLELREVDAQSRQRQHGYRTALEEAGLTPDRQVVFNTTVYDRPDSPAIQALLRATPPFTAVVATDASRAALVAQAAETLGRVIPRDLSILCFQGSVPAEPRFAGPRIDFEEMGRQAVRLLQYPREKRQRAEVPVTWHPGRTLAPPRTAK